MTSYPVEPLAAHDPRVERAMRVIAQMSPTQREAFSRTVFRYIYAYRATNNPDLLAALADGAAATITLHADPGYARAAEELKAAKAGSTGEPVDVRQLLATERDRWAG